MDFELSDEQALLRDAAQRFVERGHPYPPDSSPVQPEAERALWHELADRGWLGMVFDEADGGVGGGPIELALLFEQFGRGLLRTPFLSSAVLASSILKQLGTSARTPIIEGLISGELQAAVAHAEPEARFRTECIKTRATADGELWRIDGEKAHVSYGAQADYLVIAARTAGSIEERNGVTLFLIPAATPGVRRRDYATVDGMRAAAIELEAVSAPVSSVIGDVHDGLPLLERAIELSTLALCAEALGAMQASLDRTLQYCRERKQFNQSISSFQVVQHRLVDMFMEVEQMRSLVYLAAIALAEAQPQAHRAVSAAKVQAGKGGRFVSQQAIQLHGGIGMSDELPIGRWFKRLLAIDATFGDVDHHLRRIARPARD